LKNISSAELVKLTIFWEEQSSFNCPAAFHFEFDELTFVHEVVGAFYDRVCKESSTARLEKSLSPEKLFLFVPTTRSKTGVLLARDRTLAAYKLPDKV
jgi:hypothetical protein